KIDLAVTLSSSVNIMLGDGAGNFVSSGSTAISANPGQVRVADLNNDGKPDLVIGNSTTTNLTVLLGNGAGGFSSVTTYPMGTIPYIVQLADLDGDGALDVVAGAPTRDHFFVTARGNGVGAFAGATQVPLVDTFYAVF